MPSRKETNETLQLASSATYRYPSRSIDLQQSDRSETFTNNDTQPPARRPFLSGPVMVHCSGRGSRVVKTHDTQRLGNSFPSKRVLRYLNQVPSIAVVKRCSLGQQEGEERILCTLRFPTGRKHTQKSGLLGGHWVNGMFSIYGAPSNWR
ncbi:hypothetical protein TNCV_4459941 [Trichonephila clavipes]|nr:hypothetical protein TNCV_4459941 [Trichonephila clavipes]